MAYILNSINDHRNTVNCMFQNHTMKEIQPKGYINMQKSSLDKESVFSK